MNSREGEGIFTKKYYLKTKNGLTSREHESETRGDAEIKEISDFEPHSDVLWNNSFLHYECALLSLINKKLTSQ